MDEPTCSVDGCGRAVFERGWCRGHYARWRKTGSVNASAPLAVRIKRVPGTRCAIDGCGKLRSHGEWCGMHYARWKKHGDPLFKREGAETCSAGECGEPPYCKGLCVRHYTRWQRHGDLGTHYPALRPNGEVNYWTLHERLRKARGSAAAHQCVRCDAQGVDWAWTHGEDPLDFDSYAPMCKSCHMKYDCGPERYHERTTPIRG